MPTHGTFEMEEPGTPPPVGALAIEPSITPPVTPTSTPPKFTTESPAFSTTSSSAPRRARVDDLEIPPMPDTVANHIWSDILGAELVCCGRRLGLRKAKRMMAIMTTTIVLLIVLVLVVTSVAVREADAAEAAQPDGIVTMADGGTPCSPNPCMHDGKCSAVDGSHVCRCHDGFVGNECEIDFHTCASSPCAHGATCVDGANDYHCTCPAGFAGEACDTDILDQQLALCHAHGPCQNGGRCVAEAVSGSVGCQCIGDFSGEHCENIADAGTMSFGNGIDIADAYSSDGTLNLKFAPLFERSADPESTVGGPITTQMARSEASTVDFFETAEDLMRGFAADFDLAYTPGMLAADVFIATVRQHAYTARPAAIYGKAVQNSSFSIQNPSFLIQNSSV